MRVPALALLVVLAGCIGAPEEAPGAVTDVAAPTAPTIEVPVEIAPVGERMPRVVETFVWDAAGGLTFVDELTGGEARVPETAATSRTFATGPLQGFAPRGWSSPPFPHPFEADGDIELVVSFSSDQPGTNVLKPFGLPPVGAWIGSTDRFALFALVTDAPDTIEANKVYTLRVDAKVPDAKLFFREGDPLVVYPYLAYEVGPGTLAWHVNDPTLSAVRVGHQHFNVSAPVATVVLEESGELGPFVGPSTEENPQKADLPLKVPPDAVYLVVEVVGTSATPGHLDVDLALLAGSTRMGHGVGPGATEVVVLGPSALAQARDLVAHVTSSGGKGTFALKATAYGPAP